jgi:ribonuclease T2
MARGFGPVSGGVAASFAARASGILAAAFLCLLITFAPASAKAPRAGVFDYYVLALSWSPTYCAEQGGGDNQQCSAGRRFAFVVHGLWPQYDQGWPEACDSRENWVPDEQIDAMLPVMPSKRLIIHEWKKHGTCSGLSMDAYFDLTRALFSAVRIPARYAAPTQDVLTTPDQLVTDFVKTNRGLGESMLSVDCGRKRGRARLKELRVCFNKEGEFAACGSNEARSCRADQLVMPPVR